MTSHHENVDAATDPPGTRHGEAAASFEASGLARRRVPSIGFWILLLAILGVLNTACRLTYKPLAKGFIPYIGGFDPNSYFAQTRSLFFDGDLHFANEFGFIMRTQPFYLGDAFAPFVRENPENPKNLFPVGTALAAQPAMAVAWLVDKVRVLATGDPPASGFSLLYVLAYCTAQVAYGAAALYMAARILRRWFSPPVINAAIAATALAGSYLYYMMWETGMSHLAGAFFCTAAIGAWLRWRESEGRRAIMWAAACGAAVGLATCTRPYNAPYGLLLLEPVVRSLRHRRVGLPAIASFAVAALAGFVTFAPQLVAWKVHHGHWIANTDGHKFTLIPHYVFHVLGHPQHGLFYWTPLYLVAFVGLILGCWRLPHPSRLLLLVLAGGLWMYGNWHLWWLGVAFGMRGLVDSIFLFALGFGIAIQQLEQRWGSRALATAWILIALSLLVNVHLATALRSGVVPGEAPLRWTATLDHRDWYQAQLAKDWAAWTDWHPTRRTSLFLDDRRLERMEQLYRKRVAE